MPKMVEYQCGSSDISQSKLASVPVTTISKSPGALQRDAVCICSIDFSVSWRVELRQIAIAHSDHSAKKMKPRAENMAGFIYPALPCRILSWAMISGRAHW